MEQTLQALTGILQKAIPTIFLLIFLHWFFKIMLFGPLDKVLKERRAMTDGARKAAQNSLEAADNKSKLFEAQLQNAHSQVYKEQEEIRRQWIVDQAEQLDAARAKTDASVQASKQALAADVAAAKQDLAANTAALAEQIAQSVLTRRAG